MQLRKAAVRLEGCGLLAAGAFQDRRGNRRLSPEVYDRGHVELVIGTAIRPGRARRAKHPEALRVGGYQSALNAVVDHGDEMPGPCRAAIEMTAGRRERLEERCER